MIKPHSGSWYKGARVGTRGARVGRVWVKKLVLTPIIMTQNTRYFARFAKENCLQRLLHLHVFEVVERQGGGAENHTDQSYKGPKRVI